MHNRMRVVAASFLVKNLLLPWQVGALVCWCVCGSKVPMETRGQGSSMTVAGLPR